MRGNLNSKTMSPSKASMNNKRPNQKELHQVEVASVNLVLRLRRDWAFTGDLAEATHTITDVDQLDFAVTGHVVSTAICGSYGTCSGLCRVSSEIRTLKRTKLVPTQLKVDGKILQGSAE